MRILGIHYGHDSNAALVENGQILFAISEERLNRKKFHRGFPFLAIRKTLEYAGVKPNDIDMLALVNRNAQEETLGGNLINFYQRLNKPVPKIARSLSKPVCVMDNLLNSNIRRKIACRLLEKTVEELGFEKNRTRYTDHHLAHAAGGFFSSGFDEALIFTSDGKGDHVSHRTYLARSNQFKLLHESPAFDSAGFFYACITAHLGFKKLRHEGKVTGLAAFGDYENVKDILSPITTENDNTKIRNILIDDKEADNVYRVYLKMLGENPAILKQWLTSYSAIMSEYSQYRFEKYFKASFNGLAREDVAAFAQRHLEDVVVGIVKKQVEKYNCPNVCLSGGSFGNVRLNQKISELNGVNSVYIQPAMGDGGLSVGAATWEYWSNQEKWAGRLLRRVYLGPSYSDSEIERGLKKENLRYIHDDNIEESIVDDLIEGKIVGRYNGRMEWGPRALGNRSILVTARDQKINDTLNKRLRRTEFMPFAPIIIEEYADQYFENYASDQPAPLFMTITYNVFDDKRSLIPAVVHVDGTARPQVVKAEDNPSLHRVLRIYYKKTGIPVLINTSFNMHEEPIVCTPQEAIKAFRRGAVDVLAIGNFLVRSRD